MKLGLKSIALQALPTATQFPAGPLAVVNPARYAEQPTLRTLADDQPRTTKSAYRRFAVAADGHIQ
jgi:hypothetical protein